MDQRRLHSRSPTLIGLHACRSNSFVPEAAGKRMRKVRMPPYVVDVAARSSESDRWRRQRWNAAMTHSGIQTTPQSKGHVMRYVQLADNDAFTWVVHTIHGQAASLQVFPTSTQRRSKEDKHRSKLNLPGHDAQVGEAVSGRVGGPKCNLALAQTAVSYWARKLTNDTSTIQNVS
jgi:hypothetical protein